MSHDNQSYSSGNEGSPDNDQADNDLETTTHRASVFGDAHQSYSGQDDTNLSIPTGTYPSSHSSASYPASQSSASYSAQVGYPASHGSAATGSEQQGWGSQHAADQAWATHQQAPDQTWGTQQQAPDQTWGTQQHAADQAWATHQQAPDQAWTTHQRAPDQTWGTQQHGPDQAWATHPHATEQGWGTQQHHAAQQAWSSQQPQPPADDNVISALTDFSFTKMATPGLVKILYIAAGVLGILQLLGFTFSAFTLGGQIGTLGIVLGVLGLIGGLLGLLVFVLAVRIYLELALSVVRTSQDVRHLRSKFDETD